MKLELQRIEAKGLWFKMGIPPERGRLGGPLERQRRLEQDFYIGAYEITQAQYRAVMREEAGPGPGGHPSAPNRPIERVSWLKASEFCEKLSRMTPGHHFRLPTEMEWEYACRAQRGRASPDGPWPPYQEYCSGDGERALAKVGWYKGLGAGMAGQTKPVGQYEANRWGLHDAHGNVWEWCSDEYTTGPGESGSAAKRVIRGGAYDSRAEECNSAWRDGRPQDGSFENVGFRVIMDVP
jgi:formylglycine-generating enzyme required for sulfatase activity